MDQTNNQVPADNRPEQEEPGEITMNREAFKQRLRQAERSGVRKLMEQAGLTAETTAEQLRSLLSYAKQNSEESAQTGSDSSKRYQARIEALEGQIESLQRKKEEELARERGKREQIIVRESLLRAYLENNGLSAEVNPHAQETALRDMLNMNEVAFVVNEDDSVSVTTRAGDPVYVEGQPLTLAAWVKNYLSRRPYLVRSSGGGAGIGRVNKPFEAFSNEEIRKAASTKEHRLEIAKNLS